MKEKSVFSWYDKIPETGQFIKERGLFWLMLLKARSKHMLSFCLNVKILKAEIPQTTIATIKQKAVGKG